MAGAVRATVCPAGTAARPGAFADFVPFRGRIVRSGLPRRLEAHPRRRYAPSCQPAPEADHSLRRPREILSRTGSGMASSTG